MKRILALSFDFDGCLYHGRGETKTKNPIITDNEKLFAEINKKILAKKFDQVVIMVGSNRQSHEIDLKNAMRSKSGSCFKAMQIIEQELKEKNPDIEITINPYLLSDTYGETEHGENFRSAVELRQNHTFSNYFFDQSKLTILYAQMHKLACENPDSKITYSFFEDTYYSDGNIDDILYHLQVFYEENRDLVPTNTTLNLNFYNGRDYSDLGKIVGSGEADYHYEDSIRKMIEYAGYDYKRDFYDLNRVLNKLCEDGRLEQFKMQRDTTLKITHSDVSHPIELRPDSKKE